MRLTIASIFITALVFHCNAMEDLPVENKTIFVDVNKENVYATIAEIPVPAGFTREKVTENSFGNWLRNIELKKDRHVYLYDGKLKSYQQAQFAVLNISTGKVDLQQCADAVMRLRAEYLFAIHQQNKVCFFDNDKRAYQCPANANRQIFDNYLTRVFAACGTYSLAQQLKPVDTFKNITIGDVLIKGGSPGHAVIVVDVAENKKGEKIYMLAQSYMPAQDIHVLQNFTDNSLSPWYSSVSANSTINTPQWVFYKNQLKRW